MENYNVEQVFQQSGIPEITFVPPPRYEALRISLRTPGKCCVVEGPSGIGKTTSVTRLIDELGFSGRVTFLSARRQGDLEYICELPTLGDIGIVIIDDFHRLDDEIKSSISDLMKLLADEGRKESKLVLIGINKAGDRLVQYGTDVGLRIDVFKMEANPREKILELIEKGERALNITIPERDRICEQSQGSFQITQMLCYQISLAGNVTQTQPEAKDIGDLLDEVIDHVINDLKRIFYRPCVEFARGSKLRREGRAPYLHILKWLRDSGDWSIDLREALRANKEHQGSVGQVIDKGHLANLLKEKNEVLSDYFHYQPETSVFSTEDPRLIFYLKVINWRSFSKEVGFTTDFFRGRYDIALSFAGTDRDIAEQLFERLMEREVSVFYDQNEQHRILAEKVEKYLGPIYESEAVYVVPLLSAHFPHRIWTKFESDRFKSRFGENSVIPIRFRDVSDGYFHEGTEYGSLPFDRSGDVERQIDQIVETLCRRLAEDRSRELA